MYKFDKEKLKFTKIKKWEIILFTIFCIFIGSILSDVSRLKHIRPISTEDKVYIINEYNKFSEEALIVYMKELNIKFPHIVLAQSLVETGNYKSGIFKTNNNLFGMKFANIRPSSCKGEQSGHAYYTNWKNSVIDYALWQSRVLNVIQTEEQYYQYLSEHYAEDKSYVDLVKKIINDRQLKDKFKDNE